MTDAANRKVDVKNNDRDDIARDDPLYELSQIIGFSRSDDAEQSSPSSGEHIDLEQEMLRELENYPGFADRTAQTPDSQQIFDSAPAEPISAPEVAPPTESSEPADFETEFNRDFGDVFAAPQPVRPEPVPTVDAEEFDAMEAELYQPDFEQEAEPRPEVAEAPQFMSAPAPEAAPEPAPDSLEDELLDLLGSIGNKAGASWTPASQPAEQLVVDEPADAVAPEMPSFEAFVERAETDDQPVEVPEVDAVMAEEPPASAPRPIWFEEEAPEPQSEPDEDSALLDAFESELSEGLSISLDEMSNEEGGEADNPEADYSIEEELDLDHAYEGDAEVDEDEALQDIESVTDEIFAGAGVTTPPVLDTAELPADDIEPMQPLDLPEPAEPEARRPASYDIERELDVALTGYDQYDDDSSDEAPYRGEAAAMPAANYDLNAIEDDLARDMDYVAHDLSAREDQDDFEPFEDDLVPDAAVAAPVEKPRAGRGMMVAAIVGGVAILGAVGAFALMGGNVDEDGGPVLVRADSEPVKVVPEDPGGREVPNQDRAVYGEVDGNGDAAPTQETLVSTSEEPIDLGVAGSSPLPSGVTESAKVEDRLMPDAASAGETGAEDGQALLPPRRVRTVIVKPDGSFVPTPAPQAAAPATVAADTPSTAQPAETNGTAQPETVREAEPSRVITAADTEALQELAAAGEAETTAAPTQTQEATQPAARSLPTPAAIPERPVDQPTQVAPQPTQTARTEPAPQPVVPGGYTVQISSQPSAALAQQSATNLSRQFANILGGRAISIQQAVIEGRGTFHRVRVAASSRQDAIALCESLKRAGGSCFVAR